MYGSVHMASSPHNFGTLHELMDERDRRYEQRFNAQEEAVRLAKAAQDSQKGRIDISVLIGLVALLITISDRFQ